MTRTEKLSKSIPQFALFGEVLSEDDPEFTHIETIRARSRLYDWRITPHTHRRLFQLVYIGTGTARVHLDGRLVDIAGPAVVTLPSGVVHAFSFEPETTGHVVTISDPLIVESVRLQSRDMLEPIIQEPRTCSFATDLERAETLEFALQQMQLEAKWQQPGRTSMFRWFLRIILMTLRRQLDVQDRLSPSRGERFGSFGRFRALLETNFRNHWSVRDYAQAIAVSPSKLNRMCQHFAGRATLDVIHDRVMIEAQRLLLYTDAPIAMIAGELGFKDPAYFCRFFKRLADVSPMQFKKRNVAAVRESQLSAAKH